MDNKTRLTSESGLPRFPIPLGSDYCLWFAPQPDGRMEISLQAPAAISLRVIINRDDWLYVVRQTGEPYLREEIERLRELLSQAMNFIGAGEDASDEAVAADSLINDIQRELATGGEKAKGGA